MKPNIYCSVFREYEASFLDRRRGGADHQDRQGRRDRRARYPLPAPLHRRLHRGRQARQAGHQDLADALGRRQQSVLRSGARPGARARRWSPTAPTACSPPAPARTAASSRRWRTLPAPTPSASTSTSARRRRASSWTTSRRRRTSRSNSRSRASWPASQPPITALGLKEGGMALTGLGDDVKDSQCTIADYPDAIAKVKAIRDQIVSGCDQDRRPDDGEIASPWRLAVPRARSGRHRQALRRPDRQRSCRPLRRARRDPRGDGRERRRQVDSDEHPLRAAAPDAGEIRLRGAPVRFRSRARRHRRRHGHGASGVQAVRFAHRLGEHRLRRRAAARAVHRPHARRAPRSPSSRERHRLAVDPDAPVGELVGRRPPARRDPEGALSRRPRPHSRRADRGADAAGARRRCSHVLRRLAADGRTVLFVTHKLNEVMAITDRVTDPARRPRRRAAARPARPSAREIVRAMTGRNVDLKVDKGAGPSRRAAASRPPVSPIAGSARQARGRSRRSRRSRRRDRRRRRRRRQRSERARRGAGRPQAGRTRARARSRRRCQFGRRRRASRRRARLYPRGSRRRRLGALRQRRRQSGDGLPALSRRSPAAGSSTRRAIAERARALIAPVRRPDRRTSASSRHALGRQPAEGRRGARTLARGAGPDRRAADARRRHRRDRVSSTNSSSPSATAAAPSCSSRPSSARSWRSPTASW